MSVLLFELIEYESITIIEPFEFSITCIQFIATLLLYLTIVVR